MPIRREIDRFATAAALAVVGFVLSSNTGYAQDRAWLEQLIATGRSAHRAWTTSATLERELAALEARRPQNAGAWKQLAIGEFEADAEFSARQARAKAQEQQEYERALAKWNEEFAQLAERRHLAATVRGAAAGVSRTPLTELLSSRPLAAPAAGILQWPVRELPFFNRQSMSFDDVPLLVGPAEVPLPGDYATVGLFNYNGWANARIECKDLKVAEELKQRWLSGSVRFSALLDLGCSGSRARSSCRSLARRLCRIDPRSAAG